MECNLNLKVPLKTPDDIDDAADYITTMIQRAVWKSTPEIPIKERIDNYPAKIKKKIATKNANYERSGNARTVQTMKRY